MASVPGRRGCLPPERSKDPLAEEEEVEVVLAVEGTGVEEREAGAVFIDLALFVLLLVL